MRTQEVHQRFDVVLLMILAKRAQVIPDAGMVVQVGLVDVFPRQSPGQLVQVAGGLMPGLERRRASHCVLQIRDLFLQPDRRALSRVSSATRTRTAYALRCVTNFHSQLNRALSRLRSFLHPKCTTYSISRASECRAITCWGCQRARVGIPFGDSVRAPGGRAPRSTSGTGR